MSGILYGIGTGPGDAELMTLKAVKCLKQVDIIALPISDKTFQKTVAGKPQDLGTAEKYIQNATAFQIAYQNAPEMLQKEFLLLPMPMMKEKETLKKIHDEAAEAVAKKLLEGKNIGFLTLGDPTIYSTYLYIHNRIVAKGLMAEIINGIPSFCAAAAKLNTGLVENKDMLHIFPASYGIQELEQYPGTKVLMKSGKKLSKVREELAKKKQNAMMVENCGMVGEKVYKDVSEIPDTGSYYSLIVVK